jgi:hypothetical protein
VAIAGLVLYFALSGSGDEGSGTDRDSEAANTSGGATAAVVPLGKKLALGDGLSQSDRSAVKEIYQSKEALRKTINGLVAAYNDSSVSTEEFLGEVDTAQGQLNSELEQIKQSDAAISDFEVEVFFVPLADGLSLEGQGIDAIASALRSGTNADVESGRQTLNAGVRKVRSFDQALRDQVRPYP